MTSETVEPLREDPYTMGAESDGQWLWLRDDEAGVVRYADGTVRPYTAAELEARDARLAEAAEAQAELAADQERAVLREAVKAVIGELDLLSEAARVLIDTPNATINAGPAPYLKDLARGSRKVIGIVKDLAKLL